MADEQLRQNKQGKVGKPIKETTKQKHSNTPKEKVEEKIQETETQKEKIKSEQTEDGKKLETKTEDKTKETKKPEKQKVPKKTEVSVYGRSLPISLKDSVAIGKFIKGKKIEIAIKDLEQVILKKKAVPMTGEMAHKKGKGMMTGKYPVKASENFIKLLKSLSANGINHSMNLETAKIKETIPNKSPEQVHRFGGTKFKRTHVRIIAMEGKSKMESKK